MNSTGYSSVNDSHSTAISLGEHTADLSAEPYCTPRINLTEALTSSGPEEFKPTEDIIITTLNNYLEDFIVLHDHLTILESLGEGNICISGITGIYATNKLKVILLSKHKYYSYSRNHLKVYSVYNYVQIQQTLFLKFTSFIC